MSLIFILISINDFNKLDSIWWVLDARTKSDDLHEEEMRHVGDSRPEIFVIVKIFIPKMLKIKAQCKSRNENIYSFE